MQSPAVLYRTAARNTNIVPLQRTDIFLPLFRSKEKHPPSAPCGQRAFTNAVPPLVYPYTHAYRSHAVPSHSLRVIGRIPASPTALVGSGGGSEAYSQSAPLFLSPNGSSLYRRRLCYSSSSSLMGATIPHSAALCQLSCTSKNAKKIKTFVFLFPKCHPFRFSYRLCNTFCIWSFIRKNHRHQAELNPHGGSLYGNPCILSHRPITFFERTLSENRAEHYHSPGCGIYGNSRKIPKPSSKSAHCKSFRRACETAPMLIQPGELIVGHPCGKPRAGAFSPDISWDWLESELDTIATRAQDPYYISEADKRVIRNELFPFWKGKSCPKHATQN